MAEKSVDSSTAGIINATTPLWTVALALAVRHQRSVTGWQGAGLIVGFGGALLIFSPWHSATAVASAGGLECVAASISYIYMDKFLAHRGRWRSPGGPAPRTPPAEAARTAIVDDLFLPLARP